MGIPVIWKPVKGWEAFYEVSNYGEVRSLSRTSYSSLGKEYQRKGRIRKPVYCKGNGYYTVVFSDGNKRKTALIHRIVAEAFCDNPNNLDTVNHKNENKVDNRADNLEWCSKAYNNKYNGKDQRSCKPVAQLTLDGGLVKVWRSARAAAKELNIQYKNISAVCRDKRKQAGGFKWRFENCQKQYA